MRHPAGARTACAERAASPESIFQRPAFMDSGPRPPANPGMTRLRLASLAALAVMALIGVAAAQSAGPGFGEPRAEATAADRKIFEDGLKQFSRAWDAHDGVGMRFNEHSCLGCHSVPKPGGSGTAANTFVIVSKSVADAGGGHVFQRLQRSTDGIDELVAPSGA